MITYKTDCSREEFPEKLFLGTKNGISTWRIYFDIEEDESKREVITQKIKTPTYIEKQVVDSSGTEYTRKFLSGYEEEEVEKTISLFTAKYIDVTENSKIEISAIDKIRELVISEITAYDSSPEVNSFLLNGNIAWLDKNTRVGLINSTTIQKSTGQETITLWLGTLRFEINCDMVLNLLGNLELYALSCFNRTAEHKKNVEEINTISELISYDYTTGYPEKLDVQL